MGGQNPLILLLGNAIAMKNTNSSVEYWSLSLFLTELQQKNKIVFS